MQRIRSVRERAREDGVEMKIVKRDHYNISEAYVWSAPVGTPVHPLDEEFYVPDPNDKKAPKPVWKNEGTARSVGFSEGFMDGSSHANWREIRIGTIRNTNPRMYIARGWTDSREYEAQMVFFDVRDGVLYQNKEGYSMTIQLKKVP